MGRENRVIKSYGTYEMVFRAREKIPFPCTKTMNLIVKGIISRAQRDDKVILHHYVVEGTHAHIICTAVTADKCSNFHKEIKKEVTESVKKLLGLKYLNLWDGRTAVVEIPTLEDMISRISYVLANPSNDNLVDKIEQYPGLSSYEDLVKSKDEFDYVSITNNKWIRRKSLPKLKNSILKPYEDEALSKMLECESRESHELKIYPNMWINRFIENPTEKEVGKIKNRILNYLRHRENLNRAKREKSKKKVLGVNKLKMTPLLKKHKHKKAKKKLIVLTKNKDLRLRLLKEIKDITYKCRRLYKLYKKDFKRRPWPPGTFPPAFIPMASMLDNVKSY